MRFVLQLAGLFVGVNSISWEFMSECGKYLAPNIEKTDFEISWSEKEMWEEALIVQKEDGHAPAPDAIEGLTAFKKITNQVLTFSTFLMHGAVVAVDFKTSFMFTAKSGTGKTTHIRKWLENAPGAFVVNGDKPLIKIAGEEAIAYGTPWCGKEHLNTNIGVPLRAIVLMERSEDNAIEEITFSQAFPTLLQQTYRPADADKMRKTLSLLSALNGKMKFYRFRFNNLKPDAFRVSYEALTGKRI